MLQSSQSEWQMVFYIAAGIYTVGALVYIMFGTGELQEWAVDDVQVLVKSESLTGNHEAMKMLSKSS